MLTKSDLTATVNRLDGALRVWLADDRHDCTFRGKPAKSLPKSIIDDLESLCALVCTPDVSPDAYGLVLAVDTLRAAYDSWTQGRHIRPESTHPSAPEILARWPAVTVAAQEKPRQGPPDIASQVRQGVSLGQVARMLGWRQPDGEPDVQKLKEEIQAPGTHLDPSTWRSPAEHARERDLAEAWAKRITPISHAALRAADAPKQRGEKKPASESVLELAGMLGMRPAQICRMKAIDIDQLAVELGKLGLAIAEVGTPSARKVFDDLRENQRVASVLGTEKKKSSRGKAAATA